MVRDSSNIATENTDRTGLENFTLELVELGTIAIQQQTQNNTDGERQRTDIEHQSSRMGWRILP